MPLNPGTIDQILVARAAILDELKRRYQAGDKTVKPNPKWQTPFGNECKSENHFSGHGEMPCPVCKTGTLRYSRSYYNGHVHAACTVKECVGWME